jgi:serine phosphatase RsbU (regulator of sigma subunit)
MGDISGKGVAAAILRANLHATMRTVFSLVDDDMERSLNLLNKLFYQSTPQNSYSTFFYAEYNDLTGALRYVNCGHPAALLVHGDGQVSRLHPPALC